MSMTQEFDPRNFMAQRRERLARIAAAAVQPAWPAVEKAQAIKPLPAPRPLVKPARASKPWFAADVVFKPTIREVQVAVGSYYCVTAMDIRSARRDGPIIKPRQVAMYLAREVAREELTKIGRHFGGRDHTTVIHAVRKMEALIEVDMILAGEVAELTRRLSGCAS